MIGVPNFRPDFGERGPGPRAHRAPAVVIDRAVAHHLEVLREVLARRLSVVESMDEADTLDRRLGDAADRQRRLNAERLQHRRHHVDRVRILRADFTLGLDPPGPADDERVADAAAVGLALPAAEGGVAGIRPAPREVIESFGPPSSSIAARSCSTVSGTLLKNLHSFTEPCRPALRAGAVVRDQHDQRVFVLADVLEELDQLADIVVGVLRKPAKTSIMRA